MLNRGFVRNVVNTNFLRRLEQKLNDRFGPVCTVAEQTEVRQRLFRTAQFTLAFRELVRKLDQETPKTRTLVLRQSQNTCDIIAFGTLLLLRKVTDHVAAGIVALTHDIEQKGIHIIVQGLMVQKALA